MTDWKLPLDGGCRCGQVRLRLSKPAMMTGACHCAGCQRMTSSAFSLTLTMPSDGFQVTAGDPVIGGLHGATRHFFCPHCMSWMFTRPQGMDQIVNVRAAMLDDHTWFSPFVEVWTEEKLPWVTTPAAHSFPTEPSVDSYTMLMDDYAKRGARPS